MSKFHICPFTHHTCQEAEENCSFNPNISQRNYPRGQPCCIECYYCCIPLTITLDIICLPINLYYGVCKSQDSTISNQHISREI